MQNKKTTATTTMKNNFTNFVKNLLYIKYINIFYTNELSIPGVMQFESNLSSFGNFSPFCKALLMLS